MDKIIELFKSVLYNIEHENVNHDDLIDLAKIWRANLDDLMENADYNLGWKCPACGTVYAPSILYCECSIKPPTMLNFKKAN